MLKGHVCIDLHNHNSGFTERIEKDNTLTNALKIAYALYERANRQNEFFPIWKNALDGLLIFKDKLNDSPSNTHIPSDNDIIGIAGNTITTSSGGRGSLNTGESGSKGNPNSYTTVWDFATNQANGKISALARTHLKMGNSNIYTENSSFGDSAYYCPFAYDKTTDELFYARLINNTIEFCYRHIDLFRRRILTEIPSGWIPSYPPHKFLTISYDDANLVEGDTAVDSLTVYVDDDYLCISTGNMYYYSDDQHSGLHLTKFNIPDLMKKPSSISGVTIKKLFPINNYPKYTDMGADKFGTRVCMYKGKIYVQYYKDGKYCYASYSLDSGSLLDPKVFEGPSENWSWNNIWYIYNHNNLLFTSTNGNYAIEPHFDGKLNTNDYDVAREYCLYDYDNNLLTGGVSSYGLHSYPIEYLGTIFNLDEPITKTESTSMKITYTLSNV